MARKYKCPYCNERLERGKLVNHIDKKHEELLADGYSGARVVYDMINKTNGHGTCRVCKKSTEWNEKAGRYSVLCSNPKCKEVMREEYKKNMLRVRGTYNILNDPDQQIIMLQNRRISGQYKHSDGGVWTFTGSYEHKCLEFMDKAMQIPSKDLMTPGPVFEYIHDGEVHHYISDMMYIPYNLVIEIKDGGDNPNKKDSIGMNASRQKTLEKESIITQQGTYNYIRLTDNNFAQLLEVFMDIKMKLINGVDERTIKINEETIISEAFKYGFEGDVTITESVKSDVDPNYKPKGKINLSSLKMVHITESVIDKYKKQYPFLRHVRCKDTKEYVCDGYIWFDGGELAAMVGSCEYTDDNTKWIVSLEVTKGYKGYGLSKQILDYATKTMKCKYLSVNKSNKLAKKVYDDYGFKVYQDSDTMYYMTIDKNVKINEETIISEGFEEAVIKTMDDIYYNKDKFDSGEINMCFITGHSGSGKSTMGRNMSGKKIEHYELDDVIANWNFSDANLKEYGDLIYSFFKGPGKKYRYYSYNEWVDDHSWDNKDEYIDGYEACVIKTFIEYAKSYAKSHKDIKFVIEGIWIFKFVQPSEIDNYAVYIKGTPLLISKLRAAKRDSGDASNKLGRARAFLKQSITANWKKYFMDEKEIKIYRDYFSKKQQAPINESLKNKNLVNSDGESVPHICPKCGGDIKVFFRGEPVFLCSKCEEYFGVVAPKSKH